MCAQTNWSKIQLDPSTRALKYDTWDSQWLDTPNVGFITSIVWLYGYHSVYPFVIKPFYYLLQTNVAQSNSDINVQYYLLIFGLSMTNIRYTSFCLEQCHHLQEADGKGQQGKGQQGKGQGFSFLDMLVYIFYFPVFFSGPLMTYDEFYLQVSHRNIVVVIVLVFVTKWQNFWCH